MTQQLLHRANVVAVLEEMGREGVREGGAPVGTAGVGTSEVGVSVDDASDGST